METVGMNDRRIFERIPVKLSMRFVDMKSNDWNLVQTEDVSAKGIGLVCERNLAPYTPLEIWLPIVNQGESYYTRGLVAWSKMLDVNKYRIGIELDQADFMGMSQVLRAAGVFRKTAEVDELEYNISPETGYPSS